MERRHVFPDILFSTLALPRPLVKKLGGLTRRDDRGGAIVETAIILPFLFMLLFGIIEFGVLYVHQIALENSAQTAARYAVSFPTKWSDAEPAPVNSIQGQAENEAKSLPGFVNSPQSISVKYLGPSPSFSSCGTNNTYKTGNSPAIDSTCTQPGNMIQVTVGYTYTFLSPYLTAVYTNGIRISATAIMQEMN